MMLRTTDIVLPDKPGLLNDDISSSTYLYQYTKKMVWLLSGCFSAGSKIYCCAYFYCHANFLLLLGRLFFGGGGVKVFWG